MVGSRDVRDGADGRTGGQAVGPLRMVGPPVRQSAYLTAC